MQGRLRFETEIFHTNDLHGRNIPKIEFYLPCRGPYYLEERVEALFCLDFLLLFHQGKSKVVFFGVTSNHKFQGEPTYGYLLFLNSTNIENLQFIYPTPQNLL